MILTAKQQEGLEIALKRYNEGKPYTCISGYAGSGKSTLIKFIVATLGVQEDYVAYCAYTGKAANVLKQKGCQTATTAHKLLYYTKQLPSGKFVYREKPYLENCGLIVVDEVSMLPKKMWEQLLKHHIYILATGDPFQLPPIDPDTDNHVLDNPHVFLDEIMRQALDSEIIRLSMHIREGNPLTTFPCENQQVQIFREKDLITGMYDWADQIICATNNKRIEINNTIRALKGYPIEPQIGEKVISLHNHWDTVTNEGSPITNGTIGTVQDYSMRNYLYPYYITNRAVDFMMTQILTEDNELAYCIPIDYSLLTGGNKQLSSREEYLIRKTLRTANPLPEPPFEFAYAYAITCHKSQGSQWDNILLFEEAFPFSPEDHARWLYTGITRAAKKLVIIRR